MKELLKQPEELPEGMFHVPIAVPIHKSSSRYPQKKEYME